LLQNATVKIASNATIKCASKSPIFRNEIEALVFASIQLKTSHLLDSCTGTNTGEPCCLLLQVGTDI